MFLIAINVIFPIYVLIFLGFVSGKLKKNIETDSITFLVLNFLAPALVFSSFRKIEISFLNLRCIALNGLVTIFVVWIVAFLVAELIFKRRIPAFEISSAVMNIGYLGLPLIYILFGEKAVGYAVSYMVFVTVIHFSVAVVLLNPHGFKKGLEETVKIPLIYAILFSFLFKDIVLPDGLEKMIKLTGDSTIPLMLMAIGIKLSKIDLSNLKVGFLGTFLRFFIGTAVSFFILKVLPCDVLVKKTVFVQSSLPSAILNFVLCDRFKQDPDISASIIFVSTFFSPLWLFIVIKYLLPMLGG